MVFEKEKIIDGFELSVMKCDKFKSGVVSFSLTLPLGKKEAAYSLLLAGLLRRGCKKYPSLELINLNLDRLYGSYLEIKSCYIGSNLSLNFTAEILDNEYVPDSTDTLGGVIDIVSDILFHPIFISADFDGKIFEQEKNVVLDSLNAEINNTRIYAVRRCCELMKQNSADYPTVRELKELVSSATVSDVKKHYERLLSSSPLDVFYVGATPAADVKQKLSDAFGKYTFCNERSTVPLKNVKRDDFAELCEDMPVSQGKLVMGFSTDTCIGNKDDGCYTALMLNELLGGSPTSKLFMNVREKRSLCYYCASSYSVYTGVITVSSGIESRNREIVRNAVIEQIEEIKRGNVSDAEFNSAKKSLINGYKQLYDSPFDLQSFYSGRQLFGIEDSIEGCENKISAVTKEDVIALSKNIRLDALVFINGTGGADTSAEEAEDE